MNALRFSKSQIVRLLLVIIVMFALGVAAVPLFNGASRGFGSHGKAGDDQRSQRVDESRQVRVKFLSSNAVNMVWGFYPKADQLEVHPGAVNDMWFIAQNPTDQPMTAQAVPSISPGSAAAYFHKTECFCFTQQVLQPGERVEMLVRFIVDYDLPKDIEQLTLGYTLFNVTSSKTPASKSGG
ncbi:cytochrome c oxidase assembly protein [Pseudomonas syringae]|nr:cytochrome c oxidase assembly protein [Pseudomonas syringae]MCQ3034397.1 cytochrome c oxidase assembly protein [Pseudomonas syringae]